MANDSYLFRRHFNPYTHNYEFRNIQTGEGLFKNIKAFGKAALPSRKTIRKKATTAASDYYKQQATKQSKAASKKATDLAFSKIRQSKPKRDGKKTILRKLRSRKRPTTAKIDSLSKNLALKLLLDDDD